GSVFFDDLGLRGDHLLATVVAVGGHVVAQVGLARGRVGGQLLGAQRVVGAAHAAAGRGDSGLLHSHGIAPASIASCRRNRSGDQGFTRASSAPPMPRTDWPSPPPRPAPASRVPPPRCPVPPAPPARRGSTRPRPDPPAAGCRRRAAPAARSPAAGRLRPPPGPRPRPAAPAAAPPAPGAGNAAASAGR